MIKHAFRGPRGIVVGTSGEREVLNYIPRGIARTIQSTEVTYTLGNRGVKKWPGPMGTGSSGFPVASLDCTWGCMKFADSSKVHGNDGSTTCLKFFTDYLLTILNALGQSHFQSCLSLTH